MNKSIVTTLVKTVWKNKNVVKLYGTILYGKDSNMASMTIIHGEFGEMTLHGAN